MPKWSAESEKKKKSRSGVCYLRVEALGSWDQTLQPAFSFGKCEDMCWYEGAMRIKETECWSNT